MKEPKEPTNAEETVLITVEKAQWKHDPIDFGSTDGIKRAIEAQWLAIKALANYVDHGRSAASKPSVESPPSAPSGPTRRASSP